MFFLHYSCHIFLFDLSHQGHIYSSIVTLTYEAPPHPRMFVSFPWNFWNIRWGLSNPIEMYKVGHFMCIYCMLISI